MLGSSCFFLPAPTNKSQHILWGLAGRYDAQNLTKNKSKKKVEFQMKKCIFDFSVILVIIFVKFCADIFTVGPLVNLLGRDFTEKSSETLRSDTPLF